MGFFKAFGRKLLSNKADPFWSDWRLWEQMVPLPWSRCQWPSRWPPRGGGGGRGRLTLPLPSFCSWRRNLDGAICRKNVKKMLEVLVVKHGPSEHWMLPGVRPPLSQALHSFAFSATDRSPATSGRCPGQLGSCPCSE